MKADSKSTLRDEYTRSGGVRVESGLDFGSVVRGILYGCCTSLLAAALAALLISGGLVSNVAVTGTTTAIVWIGVFVAGFSAARAAGHGGMVHGCLAGGALVLVGLLLGRYGYGLPASSGSVGLRLVLGLVVGALGGALGLIV